VPVLPVDADHDADDVDRAEVGAPDVDRLHRPVGRLEADDVPLREVALDRRLPLDHRDHDLAALRGRRLLDEHVVAVVDAVLDHRLADHAEREHLAVRADEEAVDHDRVLDVLDREQRLAGGDPTDDRHLDHLLAEPEPHRRRHHLAGPGPAGRGAHRA